MSKKKLLKKIVISSAAVSLVVPTLGIPTTTQASQVERTMDTFSTRAVDTTGFHFNFNNQGMIEGIKLDTSTLNDWLKRSKYNIRLAVNGSYHSSMENGTIYYAYFNGYEWSFPGKLIPRTSKIVLEYRGYSEGPLLKTVSLAHLTTQNDAYWGAMAQEEMGKLKASQTATVNEGYLNTARKHIANILTASKQAELLAMVATYQEKLDYDRLVLSESKALYADSSQRFLRDNLTQTELTQLLSKTDKVYGDGDRTNARMYISTAEKLLSAKTDINLLFTGTSKKALGSWVTQGHINEYRARVKLTEYPDVGKGEAEMLNGYLDQAQGLLYAEAEQAVKELFVNNNPANVIKDTVTLSTIDIAHKKVRALENTAKKAELQAYIDKAKAEWLAKTEAEQAVKELFVSNNPANAIKETVTQATIDAAQEKVNAVSDTAKKAELQAYIDKAQAEFDVKTEADAKTEAEQAVKELFVSNNPANGIKTTVTQATIDAAQAKVNAVKDTAKKAELQAYVNQAQAELSAKIAAEQAVKELFVGNNPANGIKTTLTQATIDAAQAKVNAVKDTAKKAELQAHIDKAQAELSAKTEAEQAVKELFVSNNPANTIKTTVTQATIDAAQAKVNTVKDTAKKAELQAHINKAQAEFDAKIEEANAKTEAEQAVKELFVSNNPANAIKTTVTQATIDAAQAKVNAVKDTAKKAELQAHINKAQAELDAKTEAAEIDKAHQFLANYLVNQLYQNDEPLTDAIKATTNRAAIDAAQAQIDKLLPSAVKTGLQNKLDRARELLNIRTAVEAGIQRA
ncbi:hypothetical protein HCJ39_14000, partial [Listeria rocourtiae]|uniref:toxin Cry1Ac domain D-VI-related protein n=1 Tax=Listeria rocourtiae TaxID=647910 RepID=UPI0017F4546D